MKSLRARIGTLFVAAAVAAMVGTTAVSALAAEPGPAIAVSPPSTTATVYTKNRLLVGSWRAAIVVPDTKTVHVTLPAEIGGFVVDGFTWTLTGYPDDVVRSLPPGTKSFDVALPAELPRSSVHLNIVGVGSPPRDQLSIDVSLELSVPGAGTPPRPIVNVDLTLATALSAQFVSGASAYPSPMALAPGGDLSLTATPGFWSTGPDGSWTDPEGPVVDAFLIETNSESSVPLTTEISPDGSTLRLVIPADLPDYVLDSGSLRISVNAAEYSSHSVSISFDAAAFFSREPTVDRIDGADRYAVAVAISEQAYPQGAPVAYVVTGTAFPDALSAGPAAAKDGGPLLLTAGSSLPSAVEAELRRLNPARIVVVGGPASVPASVVTQLGSIAPTERISGADRYEVSRNLLATAFADGSASAYVATGATFPDALSAGAPAAKLGAPVVLVNGSADSVDAPTAEALRSLHPESLTIAGGPVSVSAGVESSLNTLAVTHRVGGADRYEVSTAINEESFAFADRAFLVTGSTFPDALAGSAWAGVLGMPLYVVHTDCVPAADLDAMRVQGVRTVTLLGGPVSLTSNVFNLIACP